MIAACFERVAVVRSNREQPDEVGRVPALPHVALGECDIAATQDLAADRPVAEVGARGAGILLFRQGFFLWRGRFLELAALLFLALASDG